jgi:hypothetical protein
MEDVMEKKHPPHIRLPERADAVSGVEHPSADAPAAAKEPDERTVSQDPVNKDKPIPTEGK